MKITMLVSATPHSSLSHRGVSFAQQLQKLGHEVSIMAPKRDKYSEFELDNPEQIDGVKFIYPALGNTRFTILNLVVYLLSASIIMPRLKTDLVIITKPTPLSLPGMLAKWLKHVPLILDLDDLGSEVMTIEKQPKLMVTLVAWCESLISRSAAGMVVASRLLESENRQRYTTKPLLRLSNGVNISDFASKAGTRPARIIFFGSLNRASILSPVLQALPTVLNTFPSLKVDILGGGLALNDLKSEATQLGLGPDNLHFYGAIKLQDITQYTQPGDIGLCIMPLVRTTAACSNQKVFQYMALGMCSVVTDVGDLALYVEDGDAGAVVQVGDSDGLSKTLITLLADSKTTGRLATRAKYLANTAYSWRALGLQFSDFIEVVYKKEPAL